MLCFFTSFITANAYSVNPLILEKTAAGRTTLSDTITVINNGDSQLRLYPTVNEVTVGAGGEIKSFVSAANTDRATAITSWLAVPRGRLVVPPGETSSVPLQITVHPNAAPGTYHALISFPAGSNRDVAEAKITDGFSVPATMLRIEVPDERVESLQLKAVSVNRFMLNDEARTITIELENLGDVPLDPSGDIVFYDQRGQEVASTLLADDTDIIQPAAKQSYTVTVPETVGWGKHRANLNISYGTNQRAFLQDTVFFNVLPWYMLSVLFILLLIPALLLAWYVQRRPAAAEPDGIHHVSLFTRHGTASQPIDHDINLKDNK